MELYSGTSGFSYAGWRGHFYPEKMKPTEMLSFYAERLPAVEINNTFYRLPRASVLEGWAAQVPEHFRFVLKASRRITHFKRLKGTEEETGYLLRTAAALGDRLGLILFQLPPKLPLDLERLERFLDLLPTGARAAFEFRHASWSDPSVHDLLRSRGCALCQVDSAGDEDTDADDAPGSSCSPDGPLVRTAPYGYLRLRRPGYSPEEIASWHTRIQSAGWDEAFVFFKHEEDGAGPRMALALLDQAARERDRKPAAGARPASKRAREAS